MGSWVASLLGRTAPAPPASSCVFLDYPQAQEQVFCVVHSARHSRQS